MGPHPSGYLIYGADGRMMVIFLHSDRKKPVGAVPMPAESEKLLKGLVSYTGTYTVQVDTIVHHVDVSWNESWTGTTKRGSTNSKAIASARPQPSRSIRWKAS
jgi:hypothetical protein